MGSEQAREDADGLFDKILSSIGSYAEFGIPSYRETALQDLTAALTTAREQALREAAGKARAYKAYDDDLQRSAGCQTVGERIATSILSLLTKEPKA